jgi:dihydroorotate dehydrogenase (NAD+) catalytic subunit
VTERLAVDVAGLTFRNPVLLAAGTAAYGREIAGVVDLESIGGLITKAVSVEPRHGAPAPRVAEFGAGMINAVGLANPGVEQVRAQELPWLAANARGLRVIVNVVGNLAEEFAEVVARLDDAPAVDAFELNVSCPNVKTGGAEFCADEHSLREVVGGVRARTRRPLFVKLSPVLPNVAVTARVALDAGATGITVVNTIPGLVVDVETRRPALGYGTGGVSGAGLRPVGVLATWRVHSATAAPVIGIGGIESSDDALQYILAGASLVAVGTAALRDARKPARIVRELRRWTQRHRVERLADVRGTLQWPD